VRLLLVHGTLADYRLGRLIKYSFYKNITFAFIFLFFQPFNGVSGQVMHSHASMLASNMKEPADSCRRGVYMRGLLPGCRTNAAAGWSSSAASGCETLLGCCSVGMLIAQAQGEKSLQMICLSKSTYLGKAAGLYPAGLSLIRIPRHSCSAPAVLIVCRMQAQQAHCTCLLAGFAELCNCSLLRFLFTEGPICAFAPFDSPCTTCTP